MFVGAVIPPTEQPAQHRADDRGYEPVTPFVAGQHADPLFDAEDAIAGPEPPGADDHFGGWNRLDVAQPVGVAPEGANYHRLGTLPPILDDFQNGVAAQSGPPPHMDQQQEPVSKQPAASPPVEKHRRPEQPTQSPTQSPRAHH